jgi:acyl-coenzyme A thioesterase PaaI-like protein
MSDRRSTPGEGTLTVPDLEHSSAFVAAAGLHLDHTPWGVVHGGVSTTAIEGAASSGATIAAMRTDR